MVMHLIINVLSTRKTQNQVEMDKMSHFNNEMSECESQEGKSHLNRALRFSGSSVLPA